MKRERGEEKEKIIKRNYAIDKFVPSSVWWLLGFWKSTVSASVVLICITHKNDSFFFFFFKGLFCMCFKNFKNFEDE